MAQTVSIIVRAEDRARLAAVVADRNRPQKHVLLARIILLSADKLPVARRGHSGPAELDHAWPAPDEATMAAWNELVAIDKEQRKKVIGREAARMIKAKYGRAA